MARYLGCVSVVVLLFSEAFAVSAPQSDPQALALGVKAIAALANGNVVSDVTLTGNATWIAGSDNETGRITALVKGMGESRIDLALNSGTRSYIRNDSTGLPQGETITPAGAVLWPQHNCWINAGWFSPALSVLGATSDPTLVFTYVGLEGSSSGSVQHLRAYRYRQAKRQASIDIVQNLSTVDIFLDATSLLPVALRFNTHPDDDDMTNILVEIIFSNYQSFNGIQVPMHVQKLVFGALALDITFNSATFNTGITDGPFTIQ